MGETKRALEETESNWNALAESNGYKCKECGATIIHAERELYFETGLCGHCYHKLTKDD